MQPGTQAVPSKKIVWGGRLISTLAVLFLLFDSIIHLMTPGPVVEAFGQLGYPPSLASGLGILELVCVVLYAIPRTTILGAILLTGYLGGATASQVRVGHQLFTETLFPIYVGALVWGGLFLRDDRLRAIFPLRR
ncbi:MAG TPA: DoxX family protein [bacterium]|nr:DoxX family protein [bacterium]